MKKLFLIISCLLIVSSAYSEETWVSSCKLNESMFSFQFVSPSGDPSNDDVDVYFIGKNKSRVKLNFPKAMYEDSEYSHNPKNLCTDATNKSNKISFSISAFSSNKNFAFLFLAQSDRPYPPKLIIALFNISTGELVDQMQTSLVMSYPDFKIIQTESELRIYATDEYKQRTGYVSPEAINHWYKVLINQNKIQLIK